MTALADRPSGDARVVVDMRCSAATTRATGPVRCQLLAGHDSVHAVMFCDATRRHVLVWDAAGERVDDGAPGAGRPWMRGFPSPAWLEPAGSSAH